MLSPKKLVKSFFYMLGGSAGELLLSIAITISLARFLEPTQLGVLVAVEAFLDLFKFFFYFGFNNSIMRQAAQDLDGFESGLDKAIGNAFVIKSLMLLPLCLLVIMVSILTFKESFLRELVFILLAVYVLESYASIFGIARRAKGQFKLVSGIIVLNKVLRLATIFLVLGTGHDLIWLAYAFLIEKIIRLIISAITTLKIIQPKVDLLTIGSLAKHCLGYAFVDPLQGIQGKIDKVMLNNLLSSSAVAFYSVPAKLNQAFENIMNTVCGVFVPNLHSSLAADEAYYKKTTSYMFKYFTAAAALAAILVYGFSKPALLILFGEKYSSSLAIAPLFAYVCFLTIVERTPELVMVTHASHKLRAFYKTVTIALNIILTFVLIKSIGLVGSVYATIIANTIKLLWQFYLTRKFIDIKDFLLISAPALLLLQVINPYLLLAVYLIYLFAILDINYARDFIKRNRTENQSSDS